MLRVLVFSHSEKQKAGTTGASPTGAEAFWNCMDEFSVGTGGVSFPLERRRDFWLKSSEQRAMDRGQECDESAVHSSPRGTHKRRTPCQSVS